MHIIGDPQGIVEVVNIHDDSTLCLTNEQAHELMSLLIGYFIEHHDELAHIG